MIRVYWTEAGKAEYEDFEQLTEMLAFMEHLRQDPECSMVASCSAHPDNVTKMGVADVGPEYNWTKRRRNMPRAK